MGFLGWLIICLIVLYYIIPALKAPAEGYQGDYILQSGAGYIPLYQLLQPTPNMPRCIDGDSVRPCWKDDGRGIEVVNR